MEISHCVNITVLLDPGTGEQCGLCCDPGAEWSCHDPSVSYEQAAMFEPSTVALHGLLQNEYQGGQYVAVLGGGTIGMFTMQWAKNIWFQKSCGI